MTTKKLIKVIASRTALPEKIVKGVITTMIGITWEELKSGGTIQIRNLATFKTKVRSTRNVINPHTRKLMITPSMRVLKIIGSSRLRKYVRNKED